MKLAIDISQIAFEGTGVARFTRGLIAAICANDTSNNWTFYYSSLKTQPPEVVISTIQKNASSICSQLFSTKCAYLPPQQTPCDSF